MCMDSYEINSPPYKKYLEENKHLRTNGKLGNGLMSWGGDYRNFRNHVRLKNIRSI